MMAIARRATMQVERSKERRLKFFSSHASLSLTCFSVSGMAPHDAHSVQSTMQVLRPRCIGSTSHTGQPARLPPSAPGADEHLKRAG